MDVIDWFDTHLLMFFFFRIIALKVHYNINDVVVMLYIIIVMLHSKNNQCFHKGGNTSLQERGGQNTQWAHYQLNSSVRVRNRLPEQGC